MKRLLAAFAVAVGLTVFATGSVAAHDAEFDVTMTCGTFDIVLDLEADSDRKEKGDHRVIITRNSVVIDQFDLVGEFGDVSVPVAAGALPEDGLYRVFVYNPNTHTDKKRGIIKGEYLRDFEVGDRFHTTFEKEREDYNATSYDSVRVRASNSC